MPKKADDSIIQTIRFPKDLKERMKKFEEKYYLSTSALIRRAVVEFVEREEQKEREQKKGTQEF